MPWNAKVGRTRLLNAVEAPRGSGGSTNTCILSQLRPEPVNVLNTILQEPGVASMKMVYELGLIRMPGVS